VLTCSSDSNCPASTQPSLSSSGGSAHTKDESINSSSSSSADAQEGSGLGPAAHTCTPCTPRCGAARPPNPFSSHTAWQPLSLSSLCKGAAAAPTQHVSATLARHCIVLATSCSSAAPSCSRPPHSLPRMSDDGCSDQNHSCCPPNSPFPSCCTELASDALFCLGQLQVKAPRPTLLC